MRKNSAGEEVSVEDRGTAPLRFPYRDRLFVS